MADEPVTGEPVSGEIFPQTREKCRENWQKRTLMAVSYGSNAANAQAKNVCLGPQFCRLVARMRISIDIYGKTYLKLSDGVTNPEARGAAGAPKANGWLLRLPQTNLIHVARAVS